MVTDPNELSLSKGLRKKMAEELEGTLITKSEQNQSEVAMVTESNTRPDTKSKDSASEEEDLDDSILSDSSDSIPDSLDSVYLSASESVVKSGDSLSKSGGFLAQFNQFLSKSTVPDDVSSASSPEKSVSSPMKASRSQTPSSQVTPDVDTWETKDGSQQDTAGSSQEKAVLESAPTDESPKSSVQSESSGQNLDHQDSVWEKTEMLSANQSQDNTDAIGKKTEAIPANPSQDNTDDVGKNTEAIPANQNQGDIDMKEKAESVPANQNQDYRDAVSNQGGSEVSCPQDDLLYKNGSKSNVISGTTETEMDVDGNVLDPVSTESKKTNENIMVDAEKEQVAKPGSDKGTTSDYKVESESKSEDGDRAVKDKMEVVTESRAQNSVKQTVEGQGDEQKQHLGGGEKRKMDQKRTEDGEKDGGKSEAIEDGNMMEDVSTCSKDKQKQGENVMGSHRKEGTDKIMDITTPDKVSTECNKMAASLGDRMETADLSKIDKGGNRKEATESRKENQESRAEKKEVKKGSGTESVKISGVPSGDKDKKLGSGKEHRELIEKCMAALCLCLSRFPTHYKALYRLAYAYLYSPYHKVSRL